MEVDLSSIIVQAAKEKNDKCWDFELAPDTQPQKAPSSQARAFI
jgi:hypothetical protein